MNELRNSLIKSPIDISGAVSVRVMTPRRVPAGRPTRAYALKVDADVYQRYQDLARELGVTMSRLLNDTLEYGLRGGEEPPPWWDEWQHRAAQSLLIDHEGVNVP